MNQFKEVGIDVCDELAISALLQGERTTVLIGVNKTQEALIQMSSEEDETIELPALVMPGDHAWVRETWFGPCVPASMPKDEREATRRPEFCKYKATEPTALELLLGCDRKRPAQWRQAPQMPRWASRITAYVHSVTLDAVDDLCEQERKLAAKHRYVWRISLSRIN